MIAKEFEDFLLARLDNYLIPSDQVAIFIDSHNADHVVLLLTSNGYSRVPVLTKDKHYLGTISLTDIKRYQDEHNLQEWEMVNRDIGDFFPAGNAVIGETVLKVNELSRSGVFSDMMEGNGKMCHVLGR